MTGTKVKLVVLLVVATTILGCENMNGERVVGGTTPLEAKTVESEELCNSLPLPEGTVRPETSVISKRYAGLTTNKYSTELECKDVNDFFVQSLTTNGATQASEEV